jgi:hypothetical protein
MPTKCKSFVGFTFRLVGWAFNVHLRRLIQLRLWWTNAFTSGEKVTTASWDFTFVSSFISYRTRSTFAFIIYIAQLLLLAIRTERWTRWRNTLATLVASQRRTKEVSTILLFSATLYYDECRVKVSNHPATGETRIIKSPAVLLLTFFTYLGNFINWSVSRTNWKTIMTLPPRNHDNNFPIRSRRNE